MTEWHGLIMSWWCIVPDGILALPADLAGEWHDDGTRAIVFGSYGDADAARLRLFSAENSETPNPSTPEPETTAAVEVPDVASGQVGLFG